MTTALFEAEEKIRALTEAEKRQLLAQLIAELDDDIDDPGDRSLSAEWISEAQRRRTEIVEGGVQAISEEEVFAEVREILRR
jgi:Putative addiction module component